MISHRVHRGFTITEVLATLGLLVIFFDVAGNIFKATVLLSAAGAQVADQAARTDSALLQLRRDVWNASQLRAGDGRTIDLTSTDGAQIRWQFGPDGITRTASSGAETHWPDTCGSCTVTVAGSYLDISDGSAPVRLSGPLLLSNR